MVPELDVNPHVPILLVKSSDVSWRPTSLTRTTACKRVGYTATWYLCMCSSGTEMSEAGQREVDLCPGSDSDPLLIHADVSDRPPNCSRRSPTTHSVPEPLCLTFKETGGWITCQPWLTLCVLLTFAHLRLNSVNKQCLYLSRCSSVERRLAGVRREREEDINWK